MPSWTLAIDFGTTHTVAVARVGDEKPEVVEIDGERRVPSTIVALADGTTVIGHAAEALSLSHPADTLRAVKSHLGIPTPIILNGRPHQVVNLVATYLRTIAASVIEQVGSPPREVRLTHPASWNRPLRQRFLDAAGKAGFDEVVLIAEPVAAAVSYAATAGLEFGERVAVYDLGGGTFDCAVLRGGDFAVLGQGSGDQNIGGELFDELMMNCIGERLDPATWDAIQIADDPVWMRARVGLRNEARKAKESLSINRAADVFVALPAGLQQVSVSRAEFDGLVRPYIAESVELLRRCIADAGLQPSELSAIALIGGASRSPIVSEMVADAFPGLPVSRRGDPKASVALGAAMAGPTNALPAESPAHRVTQPASPGTAPEGVRLAPPERSSAAATQFPPPQPIQPSRPRVEPDPGRRRRRIALVLGPLIAIAVAAGVFAIARSSNDSQATDTRPSSADGGTAESEAATTKSTNTANSTVVSSTVESSTSTVSATSAITTVVSSSSVPSSQPASPPPQGAVGSLLATFTGHTSLVTSARLSPDGTLLATGARDHTAKIWDVATTTILHNLTDHTGDVNFVDFDPTGTKLATASSDGTARIWDVATGTALLVLQHDLAADYFTVNTVQFSPDGALLLTSSDDFTARIWDAATGAELHRLPHASFVNGAWFSSDGSRVVTASLDDTAKVWDVATGEMIVDLAGHTDSVETAQFNADGSEVVTASDDGTAKVWDANTGAVLADLTGHVAPVRMAAFSPDGATVVTASEDRSAKVWDVASGAETFELPHTAIVQLALFTPDGTEIVTLADDYVGRVWNAADGTPIAELQEVVNQFTFGPDGHTIVTPAIDGASSVFIWSVG